MYSETLLKWLFLQHKIVIIFKGLVILKWFIKLKNDDKAFFRAKKGHKNAVTVLSGRS